MRFHSFIPGRGLRLTTLLVCLSYLLLACTGAAPSATPTANLPQGRLTFAGSTTVQPLIDKIRVVFESRYPSIVLDIGGGGSVVGIQAIHDGTVDIGMASRALKADEAEGIKQFQIAVDVLAVVVNISNPVTSLTGQQLRDIYAGRITNWKQLGGPDQMITVVAREKSSGTRGAFDELALDNHELNAPKVKIAITAGDVAAVVGADPTAIGYLGFGNLDASLKAVAIDGVVPTKETARDGSYHLVRPLLLLTGPLSQPLAQNFIDYVLSPDGQELVAEDGWVPVK
jgi:phosphate transport system substrate-binding protein